VLALELQEVLSPAALRLVCAVLLQVLQFGGGGGVEDRIDARTVAPLEAEERRENQTSGHTSACSLIYPEKGKRSGYIETQHQDRRGAGSPRRRAK